MSSYGTILALLLFLAGSSRVRFPQQSVTASPTVKVPAPGEPDAEGIYSSGRDVKAPVLLSYREPKLPRDLRKKGFQGMTQVVLIVDETGSPQKVAVAQSCGQHLADVAAVEGILTYRFRQATKKGRPVPVRLFVNVNWE